MTKTEALAVLYKVGAHKYGAGWYELPGIPDGPVEKATLEKALRLLNRPVRYQCIKLHRARRRRAMEKRREESLSHLHTELMRLNACDTCGWKCWEHHARHGISPLRTCTGEFGCALECLRYRSSELHP